MIKIGCFAGSFKPWHKGHQNMLNVALSENNNVILIVSLSDRENILGKDMAKVWHSYILPHLSNQVKPIFINKSPITETYSILETLNKSQESIIFSIYGRENNLKERFNEDKLKNNFPNIKILLKSSNDSSFSGTQVREFIQNQDFQSFSKCMPDNLNKEAIYKILSRNNK